MLVPSPTSGTAGASGKYKCVNHPPSVILSLFLVLENTVNRLDIWADSIPGIFQADATPISVLMPRMLQHSMCQMPPVLRRI
jgi:hypothetical protein